MKIYYKLVIAAIVAACFLPTGLAWSGQQWQPITGNEYNMIISGNVDLNGKSGSDYILYGFGPGGDEDCRGKTSIGEAGLFSMLVLGNNTGDVINFKVTDGTGNIYPLDFTVRFTPDEATGGLTLH